MKKPLMAVVMLLAGAWGSSAQELNTQQLSTPANAVNDSTNAAPAFPGTPAAHAALLGVDSSDSYNYSDIAIGNPASADPSPAGSATPIPAPVPIPKPRFVFGDRDDYRWQLGIGAEFLRFRSNLFSASLVGLGTNVTYFTNDWFGIEGNIATGFAPTIYQNDHVKYFGYEGGIHLGSRRARWEPWAHVLAGGAHMQPQTAGNSKNAFAVTAGGGVDFRLYARLSLRGEADYVYTRFFQQTQNNFQGFAGVVIHF
jgi:opacity protein-like surface antigen